ncbi:Transcriptional coactivator [Serendipita sp. 400]|nr:Transcriptional coactivator [Serendipita sp. 400]
MPKRKRDSDEETTAEESDASSVSDRKPKKKPTKASASKAKAKAPAEGRTKAPAPSVAEEKEINGVKYKVSPEGESYVELGGKSRRRLTIREFRGATLIDIREFYEDKSSGEMKPGKKGISLSVDEWRDLLRTSEAMNILIEGP